MYLALNANPCNPNSKLLRLSFEIFSHASRSRHQHWFGERGYASHAVLSPLLIQVFSLRVGSNYLQFYWHGCITAARCSATTVRSNAHNAETAASGPPSGASLSMSSS